MATHISIPSLALDYIQHSTAAYLPACAHNNPAQREAHREHLQFPFVL